MKINVVDRNDNVYPNNRFTKSVNSHKKLKLHSSRFLLAKVRTIDDTMLHRRLGTILSYVTDDFSVREIQIYFNKSFNYLSVLKIINDEGILVLSDQLNINKKMSSTLWMRALEKFDEQVDLNSMTKQEV